jgi:hypothetical protein
MVEGSIKFGWELTGKIKHEVSWSIRALACLFSDISISLQLCFLEKYEL